MNDHDLMALYETSDFKRLKRKKNAFSLVLTIVILGLYFGFISTAAFYPEVLAKSAFDGALSIGLVGGVLIILAAIILTGLYVWNANAKFDPVIANLIRETQK
ncbi:DUF485 domain-containing protein [Cupriavidus sp. 8B]